MPITIVSGNITTVVRSCRADCLACDAKNILTGTCGYCRADLCEECCRADWNDDCGSECSNDEYDWCCLRCWLRDGDDASQNGSDDEDEDLSFRELVEKYRGKPEWKKAGLNCCECPTHFDAGKEKCRMCDFDFSVLNRPETPPTPPPAPAPAPAPAPKKKVKLVIVKRLPVSDAKKEGCDCCPAEPKKQTGWYGEAIERKRKETEDYHAGRIKGCEIDLKCDCCRVSWGEHLCGQKILSLCYDCRWTVRDESQVAELRRTKKSA